MIPMDLARVQSWKETGTSSNRMLSLQDLQASICTAVIYSNDLYVLKGLGKQAVQAEA